MVTLICHLGLGDAILLSGAAVVLAQRHGGLRFPCYPRYYESVCSFFFHHPEIQVYQVSERAGEYWGLPAESSFTKEGTVLKSGHYLVNGTRSDISFPELFYQQLGVDYSHRWASCPIAEAAAHFTDLDLFCETFVHDDAARGFHVHKGLEGKTVYRPPGGGTILRYASAIDQAAEIDCMDSSFYHFIESLPKPRGKLFYHRYARSYQPGWFDYPRKHPWEIL